MQISTHFSLFILFLPALCFADKNLTFNNISDDDIKVTVHGSTRSDNVVVEAHTTIKRDFLSGWPRQTIDFISLKIMTGPSAELGARLDLENITSFWKNIFNILKASTTHHDGVFELFIDEDGLPSARAESGKKLIKIKRISHWDSEHEKAKKIMQRKAGMVQMRKSYPSDE
jgi:hypothetical protein